jgi:hypothetical protein
LKDVDDPSKQMNRKEMVVSLDQYPFGFCLGPNPRRPDLTSRVSKKIEETLKENGVNFHLLNRGITIVAKSLEYDNKTDRVRLGLHENEEEERYYGILDGGNTNERINKWREEVGDAENAKEELGKRFVNVQVLIPRIDGDAPPTGPMEDLMNDIKEARNTSVQVKQKSLADARQHFELLKTVLGKESYFEHISWREGDRGSVDALDIIILLMIYYPRFSDVAPGREPSNAYGHKERCLDAYLEFADKNCEEFAQWIEIVPRIIEFYDKLQCTFPASYGGRFGGIKEVRICDEKRFERGASKKYRKTPAKSQFFGNDMTYDYPRGWLFPVFAAFRILVGPEKDGTGILWKRDPVRFWKDHGEELCSRYQPHMREAGYDPKRIATNLICYQAMRQAVADLYKDELLSEAGITV